MLKDKILKVNQWLVRCTSEHLNSYLMSSGWKEIWYALGNHVLVYLHFTSLSLSVKGFRVGVLALVETNWVWQIHVPLESSYG